MHFVCVGPVQVEVCSDEPIPRTRNPKRSTKKNSETRKAGGPVVQRPVNPYENSCDICCSDGVVCWHFIYIIILLLTASYFRTHRTYTWRTAVKCEREFSHKNAKIHYVQVGESESNRKVLTRVCKIRKASVSFVTSFRPQGTTQLPMDGFSRYFVFEYIFSENMVKIQVWLKSDKNIGYFTWIPGPG